MPSTIREFVDRLASTQIMSRAELDALVQERFSDRRDGESTELAAELVRQGCVSSFQADRLSRNETLLIDDYLLLEERGAGGMARVYKARHRRMGRIVALKLIRELAAASRQAVGRFQREIKAVAALDHPNIVRAYDAGEVDGTHYLAMEYVEGEDLSHLIRRNGAVPVDKAVDYVIQAAEGLAYAHEQGIIHRDVKPSNLMLTPEGRIRVLDLGLARLPHPAELSPDDVTDAVTEAGDLLGTAAYMAPEQSQNPHVVDHRCDIYSLGCTLHFLLTGKTVYGGSSYVEKVLAHRQSAVPALRVESGEIPAELQAVFHTMIAKDPDQRYQSMGDVAQALQHAVAGADEPIVQDGPPATAGTTVVTPRRVAAAIAVVAIVGVIVALAGRDAGEEGDPPGSGGTEIAQAAGSGDGDGTAVGPNQDADPVETHETGSSDSPSHTIAAALISRKGKIDIDADGQAIIGVSSVDQLPAGEFRIVRISFAGAEVDDSHLAPLAQLPALEYLDLADTAITSNGVQAIAGAPALRTLYLSSTRIDNSAMEVIAALPSLSELDLRGTRVDDAGLESLVECRSLRTLRLGEGQPLTGAAIAHVAQMTWLTSLGLRGAPVDDEGVEALKELRQLSWLDLGSTPITGASTDDLSSFTQLGHLLLDNTGVTRGEIESLRKLLPNCEVSY